MADNPSYDVLEAKVQFQGEQLEKLSEDTAKQLVDLRDTTQSQLTLVRSESREQFSALNRSIETLVTNIASSARDSKTSWVSLVGTGFTAVAVASAFLGTLATLRLTPIENDVKTGKDNQAAIVNTLDKVAAKLDNFETRAEITERNRVVDTALANKADNAALDFAIRERKAETERLASDIVKLQAQAEKGSEERTLLRVEQAKAAAVQTERRRELDKVEKDIDAAATDKDVNALRDRVNIISNRVQGLTEQLYGSGLAKPQTFTPQQSQEPGGGSGRR